jgi:glycosyltransferase involved in cell wall biosynthesis
MPSIYAIPSVFFLRIPLVNAMIADAKCNSEERFRLKITAPFSKVILSNSIAGLKAYGANGLKGTVIYNGFNFDRLIKTNNSEYKKVTRYNVGMIAAFYSRKDYETYLSVADEITKHRDDITFYAVGDGDQKEKYVSLYAKNKRIVFTGNINNVEAVIKILDIGVLLSNSNEHLEGISNSILEIMAFGKPVIASKGGGTDEIIVDGRNGFLINAFSKDQLNEYICFLIENETVRLRMGENAEMDIKRKFSIDQMCRKTFQLYEKIHDQ